MSDAGEEPRENNNDASNEDTACCINDTAKTDYMNGLAYEELSAFDKIDVKLGLEKRSLLTSYQEYVVKSKRLKSSVERRFNDFVTFHDLLNAIYPYRLVPKLPPKKALGVGPDFLEERRKALQRWLTIVNLHPIIGPDIIAKFFMTYSGPNVSTKIKELYEKMPDEFATSCIASKSKDLIENLSPTLIPSSRLQIQVIYAGVLQLKKIMERGVKRSHEYAADMAEIGHHLLKMACDPHNASEWGANDSKIWEDSKRKFGEISDEFSKLYLTASKHAFEVEEDIEEKLGLIVDILVAHELLCDRYEKGVAMDHQKAKEKLIALKKANVQRQPSREAQEALGQHEDRMLEQEGIISDIEMRKAYSLHCMKMETQLVQVYLENVRNVLDAFIDEQEKDHSELAKIWTQMKVKNALTLMHDEN